MEEADGAWDKLICLTSFVFSLIAAPLFVGVPGHIWMIMTWGWNIKKIVCTKKKFWLKKIRILSKNKQSWVKQTIKSNLLKFYEKK